MKIRYVVITALVAGMLGAVVGLMIDGPGPVLRSKFGQRVLHTVFDAQAPTPPAGMQIAARGQPMPSLQLPDLNGKRIALPDDYRGRPLLINFWASWCAPCIEEMPELQRFSDRQDVNSVQVIGIALDERDAVLTFLQRVAVRYPILLETPSATDASVRLGNRKGVLPYSVLINAQGHVLDQRIGPFARGEIDDFAAIITAEASTVEAP